MSSENPTKPLEQLERHRLEDLKSWRLRKSDGSFEMVVSDTALKAVQNIGWHRLRDVLLDELKDVHVNPDSEKRSIDHIRWWDFSSNARYQRSKRSVRALADELEELLKHPVALKMPKKNSPEDMVESYEYLRRSQLAATRTFTPDQTRRLAFCEPYAAIALLGEDGKKYTFLLMERVVNAQTLEETGIKNDPQLAAAFGYPTTASIFDVFHWIGRDKFSFFVTDVHDTNVLVDNSSSVRRYVLIDQRRLSWHASYGEGFRWVASAEEKAPWPYCPYLFSRA